ncbi:MAG: phosphatidate cytidylyltransferase [Clostridiaceae bacterium]|nr:phosphatidate cytidylyltransferase [Clostridiaceae bacterium]
MGIRLVTTITGIIAIIFLLYFAPSWALTAVICLLAGLSAYELLGETGELKGHPLLYISCIFAAAVPYFTAYATWDGSLTLILFSFGFIAFVMGIFDYKRVTFDKLAMSFMGAFILPYFLSSLLRIYIGCGEMGKYYILMPCIAAWVSDMLAYIVGRAFGKHKLAPHVSPKKTIEGSVGGILGGAIGMYLFGYVMNAKFGIFMPAPALVLSGILGAAAGQLGDLSMSLIKRNVGIKDFGRIFPGHGGVLDRFDSILFTAPIFELYLIAINIIGA